MNRIARLCSANPGVSWLILLLVSVASGWLVSSIAAGYRGAERRSLLETEAQRRSLEVMAQTLNGSSMGAIGLLGLIDENVKREARNELAPNSVAVARLMEDIARTHGADGTYVVGGDGIIKSSWGVGRPLTGVDVKFRPYAQMALKGKQNVYAAIGTTTGRRNLYFASPLYSGSTTNAPVIGAVVMRHGVVALDRSISGKSDLALLLSPQGLVFASSSEKWIGHSAGALTPDRIKEIRELRQFGNLFEENDPPVLPMSVEPGIREVDGRPHIVTSAKVQWNDPMGDWSLVLMEDLTRSVPSTERLRYGLAGGMVVLLLGWGMLRLLRGHYAQQQAGEQLAAYSTEQKRAAERKAQLSEAGLQMQQAGEVDELVRCYFNAAHRMFGALQGVVYRVDRADSATMALAGSYACADPPPADLAVGEGLLGQCAVERRSQVIDTAATGFSIRSGLGETAPAALLLAPLLLHDRLLGVVELALLHRPAGAEQEQFEELTGLLAMNVEIIDRSAGTVEQLAFQRALLDTFPYPVFYKGADSRFLGVNRAYEEVFGVHRDQLIGRRVLDLDYLPEADRQTYQAEDEAIIADAATVKHDMRIPYADGSLHDAVYSVSGFRKPDGTPGGLVGTFMDVSDVRTAERELSRMADLERFNRLAQGRETRILELKREINDLCDKLAIPPRYGVTGEAGAEDSEFFPVLGTAGQQVPSARTEAAPLKLAELVDLAELQKLFTAFCDSVGIASAIIDLEGTVLVSANWQRACTDFHRVNPESCKLCIESDTDLALRLQEGQDFTMYTCRNGMTDAASPIVLEGRHLANVFIGQFHLGPPDLEFFRQQAQRYGYSESEYLDAISTAPMVDEKRLPAILGFLSGFARMIGSMSLARSRADAAQTKLQEQAELLRRERLAAMSLAEDADAARQEKQQGAPA